MLLRSSLLLLLLSVLLVSSSSFAQEAVDEAAESEARIHFNLAQRYYDTGRFAEAALEFRAAYELTRLADLLYNAFLAYREAGDYAHAVEALEDFLPQVTDPVRRRGYEARLVHMRELIAGQAEPEPEPESEPESVGSNADDAAVSANGHQETPEAEPVVPDARPSQVQSTTVVPWIMFGVGGAMLVASAVTGPLALSAQSELDGMCDSTGCQSGYEDVQNEGTTLATTTDVLLIGGLTLAGVGLVWGLLSGGSETDIDVQASCTRSGCGTMVSGQF